MESHEKILHNCLYFAGNALSRVISRMADDAFRVTGLSPSHAFLMMLVNAAPGTGQKELCKQLHLAPSTVTRFIDSLVHRGCLVRKSEGKVSKIFPTDKGKELAQPIADAWKSLYERYSEILGKKTGNELTRMIDEAGEKLASQT